MLLKLVAPQGPGFKSVLWGGGDKKEGEAPDEGKSNGGRFL